MVHRQSLAGKRVFLTGAAPADDPDKHTLGELFANALVAEGAEVFLVDIKPSVREFAQRLSTQGFTAHSFVADVTMLVDMQAAAETAVYYMGGIDVFIANAGMADITTFQNDPARYRRICAVNETGVYNTIQVCMPFIKAEGRFGLVNASNGGIVPLALMMAYNASKAHAIKLAEGCNLEMRGTGARCGVLLLSEHASPMEDNFKKSIPRRLMKDNILLRYGHKERDSQQAVNGMLRAVRGRRLYTSVPRYSAIARYFPAIVGVISRLMHHNVQPAFDMAREEYEQNQ